MFGPRWLLLALKTALRGNCCKVERYASAGPTYFSLIEQSIPAA
jgi:hypothetical protein